MVPNTDPSPLENVQYNRGLWDTYAEHWDKQTVQVEDLSITPVTRASRLNLVGGEWGTTAEIGRILEEDVCASISGDSVVGELAVGGGRIDSKVSPRVKHLHCFGISPLM